MRMEPMPNSKHPGLADSIDYARGSLPAEQAAKFENHLGQGCPRCSRLAAFWKLVWRTAQDDARFQPPENLVRAVEVSTGQYLPDPRVRLLFDSWREPLPALIRSAATVGHHVIYQVGPVLMDLQTQQAE